MTQLLWEKLRQLIAYEIGFCIRSQDIQYFQQKIETRIKKTQSKNLAEYYHLLTRVNCQESDCTSQQQYLAQKEWKTLTNILTNGESFFFRDRGQFDLLTNEILPKIIADKYQEYEQEKIPYPTLKIWSAGCSTGEEVYSLAMLISELIPDPGLWNIAIIGTDINQNFLNIARQGIYKQWSFRLTEPLLKSKYFITNNQNWQVKPHLKSMVSFYHDNLMEVNKVSHYNYGLDLVICRNVFIYFELESIIKAITKISQTLRLGAYFISGHAELQALELNNFKTISFPQSVVYQYLGNNQQSKSISVKNIVQDHIDSQIIVSKSSETVKPIKLEILKSQNLSRVGENLRSPKKVITTHNQLKQQVIQHNSLEQQLSKIQALLEQGEYNDVINQAQQLIEQKLAAKESYYLLAQAYANQGSFSEAENNCALSLDIDSIYIKPLLLLAQIAEEKNDYRKAKELLKRVIYLEPGFFAAYLDLGAIYQQENNLERAKKMYQAAYDILQKLPSEQKINYQGQTKASNLLTHIKFKL